MPSLYPFRFWHTTPISFSIFNESSKHTAVCQLNYMNVEDNCGVYEGKDAFLRLPTSFDKSVCYKVLSFACLTINKVSWVEGGVATPLSC